VNPMIRASQIKVNLMIKVNLIRVSQIRVNPMIRASRIIRVSQIRVNLMIKVQEIRVRTKMQIRVTLGMVATVGAIVCDVKTTRVVGKKLDHEINKYGGTGRATLRQYTKYRILFIHVDNSISTMSSILDNLQRW
jgi:hypothetical protein